MKELLAKTNNGVDVYMDVEDTHMLAHKGVPTELIAEAVSKVVYNPTFFIGEVEMGRVVGVDGCVKTSDTDDVFFACREGRSTPSRLVRGRKAEPTTKMVVGICNDSDDNGVVTLFTAFFGVKAPKELDDPRMTEAERPEAEKFWADHALVVD